ncbi:MAG: hypothetical protein NWF01_00360 [Candidatus Bathyarchaeota archaeon]|nr:hypothetical protein [Candidatus Bathyarchaeota archaeon]
MSKKAETVSDGIEDLSQIARSQLSSPRKAIVSISEYPGKIILNAPFISKNNVLPLFISKSSKDIVKWNPAAKDFISNTISLNKADTHFWFNVAKSGNRIASRLKQQQIEKLKTAIIVSSTWDGMGSALLPMLVLQLKELNVNSVAIALLPSQVQPMDSQFNMVASIGTCASKDLTTVILVNRDNLESYIGVDRSGSVITGNSVTNYFMELLLSKDKVAQEVSELAKLFDSKMFTVLLSTGASLQIYGSIENMISTTLLKPLLTYDLADSKIIYAIVRIPLGLKEKVTQGKVELAIANCFKNLANIQTIMVTEPVYVEEENDRIDIALLVGGFDLVKMFAPIEETVQSMKDKAVKEQFITDNQWLGMTYKITGKDPPPPEIPLPPEPETEIVEEDPTIIMPLEEAEQATIIKNIESTPEIETVSEPVIEATEPEEKTEEEPKRNRTKQEKPTGRTRKTRAKKPVEENTKETVVEEKQEPEATEAIITETPEAETTTAELVPEAEPKTEQEPEWIEEQTQVENVASTEPEKTETEKKNQVEQETQNVENLGNEEPKTPQ